VDKERIDKMALSSGLEHKKLDDGSMGFRPYIYKFVERIESHLAHKYDEARKKDQQDLIALRQKVQNLAGENIKLRAHIKNARECLDEVSNG
jgi:hypothetical protein